MCLSCSLFCEITCAPPVFIMIRPEFAYDPDPACRRRRRQAPHFHPTSHQPCVVIASKFVRRSLSISVSRICREQQWKSIQHTWMWGCVASCRQIPHACLATVFNLPWAPVIYSLCVQDSKFSAVISKSVYFYVELVYSCLIWQFCSDFKLFTEIYGQESGDFSTVKLGLATKFLLIQSYLYLI